MRRRAPLLALLAAGLVAAGWWAGRTAFFTPADPLSTAEPVTYRVVEGTIGRSLQFAAQAEWTLTPIGTSWASGVVTSILASPGGLVDAGDVVFAVDLRPVVIAEGSTPSFRDLGLKAVGPDVEQLQRLLDVLGLYDGDIDGVFGTSLRTAVKGWQTSLGVEADGVVRAGDLVYVSSLPARIVLDDSVVVGRGLTAGTDTVWLLPEAPVVRIPLIPEQRSLVPLAADVLVTYPGGVWSARISEVVEDDDVGRLYLYLTAPDGGVVCGSGCTQSVPLLGVTDFPAEIVVTAERTGPIVPAAALGTSADGGVYVTLPDGSTRTVTLLGVADGLAVVEGISVGDSILLPFERSAGQS